MPTMKAVRIHTYGGLENLIYEDSARPTAEKGEILIRVHATAVSPFDCAVRAGHLSGWYSYSMPHILGLDVSGVVEEIGSGVAGFAAGDDVYARVDPARNGAYAEYVTVSMFDVASKPPSLDHPQAAALPQVGLTAWRALIEAADLSPGQTVLIHAAAGGVGSFAVQLAKWRGATVIGTASRHNHDFLYELGADRVIDYNTTRFEDLVSNVDVVLDSVGGDTLERSWSVLKPGGILLSIVQQPAEEKGATHGVRQQFVAAYPPAGDVLKDIATLVEAEYVKPVVSSVLTLQEIQRAQELVETNHMRGKLVLKI